MLHILLLSFSISLYPQTPYTGWELLASVEITTAYDEFVGGEIEKPSFSEALIESEGKRIVLEGFIVPLDQEIDQDYFVLSRFPYQSCFFCGGAGPETVVEVFSDQTVEFTDDRIKVEGDLILNRSNPLQLFYVLENSKLIE